MTERWRLEAASVTAGAVRCNAWLGVSGRIDIALTGGKVVAGLKLVNLKRCDNFANVMWRIMAFGGEARDDNKELRAETAKMEWNALGGNIPCAACEARWCHVCDASLAVANNSDWLTKWRL